MSHVGTLANLFNSVEVLSIGTERKWYGRLYCLRVLCPHK
jgi:hypothetical protein